MTTDEVLVVGAGPAGSIAALVLARAGVRVRLVDRACFPRDKLCGDTLNPGSLSILDRLGIAATIRRAALPIDGMLVTGPGGVAVSATYPSGFQGVALSRRDLDVSLVRAAVAAGVVFDERVNVIAPRTDDGRIAGVRVASATGTSDIPARVVIAADGRASRLARAVELSSFARAPRRWAYGAYVAGVRGVAARGEMHIRPDGYIGLAPLPSGLTNVCVVKSYAGAGFSRHDSIAAQASTIRLRRLDRPDDAGSYWHADRKIDPVLASAVAADPLLRDRFAVAEQASPLAVLGPLAVDATTAGVPGLLLAGDAAGFVDPMTGDGMRFALRGGELAAEAAMRELATGRPAHASLRGVRAREFTGKWRMNRMLRMLVGTPWALSFAATVTTWSDTPVRLLIAAAGDVGVARRARRDERRNLPRPAPERRWR